MRRFIVPAVLAAVVTASPLAFAAETTDGTVKAYNAKTHVLTLWDDIGYTLAPDYKAPMLKPGERVSVVWNMKDGKHMVSSVTIRK